MSGRGNTSMGDHLRVNHLGITSHLGQLGLSSFRGSINEYRQYAGGKGMRITSVGWQVTLCDVRPLVMWDLMSTAVVAIKSRILAYYPFSLIFFPASYPLWLDFLYGTAHTVSAIFPSSSGRKCHPTRTRQKAD